MADGIWTSMSGAVARGKKLHHVANDLANLGSVGYRRHAVSFKQHLPGEQHDIVEQAPLDMSLRVVNRDTAMVKVDESRIREEQGLFDRQATNWMWRCAASKLISLSKEPMGKNSSPAMVDSANGLTDS